MDEEKDISARLKAPRAGAVAGILFSILLAVSLTLIRLSVPYTPDDPGRWLAEGSKSIHLALTLLPFAGICFLWFVGVLRDRMGVNEDRFLATVFLGSGLLFLAMVFVSSAVTGALIMGYEAIPGKLMDSASYTFGRGVSYEIANVYALRMAGVFMISTCTIDMRIGIFPRWMAYLGYIFALYLLVGAGRWGWSSMVFPVWTFVISVFILIANFRPQPTVTTTAGAEALPKPR
jgi:hypothetical protein